MSDLNMYQKQILDFVCLLIFFFFFFFFWIHFSHIKLKDFDFESH